MRRAIGVLVASVIVFWAAGARADGITINMVTRTMQPSGRDMTNVLAISQEDCLGVDAFTFAVTIGTTDVPPLVVWMSSTGADCSQAVNRQPSQTSQQFCVQLAIGSDFVGTGKTGNITVTDHEIATHAVGVSTGCVDTSTTSSAARQVTLYFMPSTIGTLDTTVFGTSQVGVDLIGPQAPTITDQIAAGDTILILSFMAADTSSDVKGYKVFCDDGMSNVDGGTTTSSSSAAASSSGAGGTGGTGGAGGTGGTSSSSSSAASTSASTGAGGGTGASCLLSSSLAEGKVPDPALFRGSVGTTAATINATGLTNGTFYACGVTAYDTLNNPGPLSAIQCSTPEPVDDFFDKYRKDGGLAGGGFCAFGVSNGALSTFGFSTVFAALVLAMRRARRRK